MKYPLLPVFSTILNLVLVTSHAALPAELYWNSVLPNTPMPKAITHTLHPDTNKETSVNVGKGGGVSVHTHHRHKKGSKPVSVTVGSHSPSPFLYNYAATETQLHDNHRTTLFFLEKDLHSGTKMNLNFNTITNSATFLSRRVANSTPFSSNKFSDILKKFSVKPESEEAQIMKNTIKECEDAKSDHDQEKYCATSLESMVDFSILKLGKNVEALSTVVDKKSKGLEKYRMKLVKKLTTVDKVVVCHKQNYPYAVFYCHKIENTRGYFVSLEGENGSEVKAIVICHEDTSKWNPKHIAFQVLKIKPGTFSVCHFLPEDHVVWVPK